MHSRTCSQGSYKRSGSCKKRRELDLEIILGLEKENPNYGASRMRV